MSQLWIQETKGINKLTHQGFSCDLCSDGISYPEKIMSSVLTKLNIEFTNKCHMTMVNINMISTYQNITPSLNTWYATL